MKPILTLLFPFLMYTSYAYLYADQSGNKNNIQVWHVEMEIHQRRDSSVERYYPYGSVNKFGTRIDRLPKSHNCNRGLLHRSWKRLPQNFSLDERPDVSSGCNEVLSF